MVKAAGIYIHIPFCERKCTYCNFNTTDFFDDLAARFAGAVTREIACTGELLSGHSPVTVDTIYFGGGTPSIVEPDHLASLIGETRRAFDVVDKAEITIEINPATFTREKIVAWVAAGINRASVGAQSFIDRELSSLSRTHTAVDTLRTVEQLREAGLQNISLDLIAGLPGQRLPDWRLNLGRALDLRPEHLSLYLLEIKEGTQLYAQLKRRKVEQPDDDLAADMYNMICDATAEAGYEQYEISNFALAAPGIQTSSLRSKHNMKYWTGAPFYGMGCGAHSYDGRARWINILKTESYIEEVNRTGRAVAERRELTGDERASEALFMGLRLVEGIDLDAFCLEYGLDVREKFRDELARLEEAGLVRISETRLALTGKGRLLSNEVFVHFI
ncbi:MAG TPA: radical SAM family heme chaperone HemW [Blastocatellia bacterium]